MTEANTQNESCTRSYRQTRLDRWARIYDQALSVIEEHLGNGDHRQVNAACVTLTTASREIQTIAKIEALLSGEVADEMKSKILGWKEVSEEAEA